VAKEIEAEAVSPEASPKSQKSQSSEVMKGLYFGTEEQSFQVSTYHPDSFRKPYNPDQYVAKDYTYGIYEKMMEDDQVSVALQLKKDIVIGSGWHISSADDDIKKQLEALLEDEVERPLSEILQDIVQCYEYGFSLSEKIFKNTTDGMLALKDIRPRHPSSWLLHTDDHGNITRFEQRGPRGSIDVEPSALIHYPNNMRHQNPYGRSDLYTAYQAWMTKRHITRFYSIFLENAAGAKPVAKYDRRAPASAVQDIFDAIKSFQTKTALAIPKDFEIEFLEAKNDGESYIKGINLFNMFIGRACFIPDLLGFSGGESGGGSFALGKEQVGLFYKHINRRREVLERIMDQHVIRPLCIYNYGQMDEYPKFKFNPLSDEDATKQAELWIKGVQGIGYVPSIEEVNHFRSLVKFPASDEIEMKAMAPAWQSSKFAQDAAPIDEGNPNEDDEETGEEPTPGEPASLEEKKEFGVGTVYKTGPLKGDYSKKVDFKYADQTLKTTVAKIKMELEPIVGEMFEDLYSQLQKKKIVQRQDLDRADTLKLKNLGRMQSVFKRHFRRLHDDGFKMAKGEVIKSDFAKKTNLPVANNVFLSFLEKETYKYVGDYEDTILNKTKKELIKAIKDGNHLSSVISVLDDEGNKLSDVSLERYARTKTTEVFNRGRVDYFKSTGVVSAYQFSAILDDVTSDICGELNGLTFPAGEAPIPPLHFNCRSVLIPITKFEEWSADGVTNSGRNVDKFLETNINDKWFSVYSHAPCAHAIPKITDHDTEFQTEFISSTEERVTYHKKGISFLETTVIFTDESKMIIKSKTDRRLDDAPVL